MDLDATDLTIIDELQQNGRITNTELAERVGLSPSACLRRTKALEHRGVIDRYVAILDPAPLERATTVFVEITLGTQRETSLDAFEAAITTCPQVMSCHLTSGDADYLVRLACHDVSHYEQIHRDHLSMLPGVTRLRSSFAMRQICDRSAYDLGGAGPARS